MKDDKVVGIVILCIIAVVALIILRDQAKEVVLTIVGSIGGAITGDLKKKLKGEG